MKDDQRQEEEEQFSFLNIHAWEIMSHCKEISDVQLIAIKLNLPEAYTLVVQHFKYKKKKQHNEQVESKGVLLNLPCKFIYNLILKNAESKDVLLNLSCKFIYNLIKTNAEPKYMKVK